MLKKANLMLIKWLQWQHWSWAYFFRIWYGSISFAIFDFGCMACFYTFLFAPDVIQYFLCVLYVLPADWGLKGRVSS